MCLTNLSDAFNGFSGSQTEKNRSFSLLSKNLKPGQRLNTEVVTRQQESDTERFCARVTYSFIIMRTNYLLCLFCD